MTTAPNPRALADMPDLEVARQFAEGLPMLADAPAVPPERLESDDRVHFLVTEEYDVINQCPRKTEGAELGGGIVRGVQVAIIRWKAENELALSIKHGPFSLYQGISAAEMQRFGKAALAAAAEAEAQ